jgi:hypothetical protein
MLSNAHAPGVIEDAQAIFDSYLAATPDPPFVRTVTQGGHFLYPEPTIQTDTVAFSAIFTCLWRALEDDSAFDHYHTQKITAFHEILRIVTPNESDPHDFASQARFWSLDKAGQLVQLAPTGTKDLNELCWTLRNGFSHFNFRYVDLPPAKYFERLGLPLPPSVPAPAMPNNYRIFICDWRIREGGRSMRFLDPRSDRRVIETHFAHLRYHLFRFLARFFAKPGYAYQDILTQEWIT